ncbi:MAG: hypothetical protein AMXMBFR52_01840 [Burkholderiales bacterium]|jgi:hypothetical protein
MARADFTVGRLSGFECPADRARAFLWDTGAPGLALRATAAGARAFVFQGRLRDGCTLRMAIGEPTAWSIPAARAEAWRLRALIEKGVDPRAARS